MATVPYEKLTEDTELEDAIDSTDQMAQNIPELQTQNPSGQGYVRRLPGFQVYLLSSPVPADSAYPTVDPPSVAPSAPFTEPPPPYPGLAEPSFQQPLPFAVPTYDHGKSDPTGLTQLPPSTTTNNQQTPVAVNIVRVDYGLPPDTYMVFSICTTFCCCFILGIIAIVKSSQVSPLWAQGKFDEARKASEQAKSWNIAAVVVGMIIAVAGIIIRAVGV